MRTPLTTPLSDKQLAHFHREGYLPLYDIFTADDLQPVIDEVSSEVDRQARLALESGEISDLHEALDFSHRLAAINEECRDVASRMWNSNVVLPSFFHLMRTPRLLDAVEQLVGPEIIASSVYRLRPKVPSHHASAVPWHQDSSYFEPYCDKALVLTVWLPLVDANASNGCMWVKPKSHTAGRVVTHRQADGQPYLEITPDTLAATPGDEPVCVPIPKGGCLLMTNLTAHASFSNQTDGVRWSMDLRYQSAELPTNAEITREASAVERLKAHGAPIACYPPEADFLIRSSQHPEEAITSPDEFVRLRNEHIVKPATNRFNGDWN